MYRRVRRLLVSPEFVIANGLLAGLAGFALALFFPNAYAEVIPAFLVAGTVLGTTVYSWNPSFDHGWATRTTVTDAVIRNALLAGYLLLVGAILLLYTTSGFRRTLTVQSLQVGVWVFVAALVFVLDRSWPKLALVIATALFHRGLIYYASATQIGIDALFHNRAAALMVATGSMDPLATSKYWYTPLYHLLVGGASWALGISTRDAAFLTVTVAATVVPPLVVYYLVSRYWNGTTGVVGAFLYLVADKAIVSAVHTIPTTLGVVFFALLLLFAQRYLDEGHLGYLGAFVLAVVGMMFTHQLSMFAAFLLLSIYVLMFAFWRGGIGIREVTVVGLLTGGFVVQSLYTQAGGPEGEGGSFLVAIGSGMLNSILAAIRSGGTRSTELPPDANAVLTGAASLTPIQVIGMGILFSLAVVGAVYWVADREGSRGFVVSLGAVVVVTSLITFGTPALGLNVFIPSRWFPFLYVVLATLAAPGVAALFLAGREMTGTTGALIIVVLLITAPYTVFMTMNSSGAIDNPVFDDAPGATRLSTTEPEAAAYRHVDRYAVGPIVLADHAASQQIRRNYGHPASIYATRYGEPGTPYDATVLVVYRDYAQTNHGSYELEYQGRDMRVFGPMPGPLPTDSVVYSDGSVRLVYRPDAG